MYYACVLQNPKGILYKGSTDNLERRVEQHNLGHSRWTKNKGPWRLVYREEYELKSEALKREKFFKSGIGRSFLKDLLSGRSSVG